MKDRPTICILGGNGPVGRAAYKVLKSFDYYFRIGVRNIVKAAKDDLYAAGTAQIMKVDLDNSEETESFCHGGDLVIGAIGPSARYSEKMLQAAITAGVPYIDPGGMHLRKRCMNTTMDTTAIVGAGVFPGLSGWILRSESLREEAGAFFEIVIGGEYNFSKGSAIDFVEEATGYAAGIPMACIRNGKVVPAEGLLPKDLPDEIADLSYLPYVTEEIQEILYDRMIRNVDAYTAAPAEMFALMNSLHVKDEETIKYLTQEKNSRQRAVIWLRKDFRGKMETILFEGDNPGELTGKIVAISANEILHRKNINGIFSMADYLSDYPLLRVLAKIDNFRYKKGRI